MASEFQRRKVAAVFAAMDTDDNGYLEQPDFETLTRHWVSLRGWPPGSADYERVRAIVSRFSAKNVATGLALKFAIWT